MHELSRRDARRIAVRAQLLERDRPASIMDVVRGLTVLQYDSSAAFATNADLVLWSRLGSAYDRAEYDALVDDHQLIELNGMVRPAEDIALYRADMAAWPGPGVPPNWRAANARWVEANDACRREVLQRLKDAGPLPVGELPDTCAVPWRSSGWNNRRNLPLLLEMLTLRGEVAVTGRDERGRLWDLASRVYPRGKFPPSPEAERRRNEKRLQALGIARPRGQECPVEPWDVGAEAGEPAVIEGVRGLWRVDPAALGQAFAGRTAIISPLDRLIHDRKRMVDVFEFDYALEMFKPAAKRRWGYFALPILKGDAFVGKIDATADRKAGVLRVDRIHEDVPFSTKLAGEVHHELRDLARWMQLKLMIDR